MSTLKLTISVDVTLDVFENIVITALEGGSNYWYKLGTFESVKEYFKAKGFAPDSLSSKIAKALYTDPEFKLPVYDIEEEDGEEPLGYLTQASLLEALAKNPEEAMKFVKEDDYDAETADILFQTAVMGEVVFG